MAKIAFIDHYDSFSFNVLDWLSQGGILPSDIRHVYWDDREAMRDLGTLRIPLVFGPGPNSPRDVIDSCNLAKLSMGQVPLLGLCLGHQIFGYLCGAKISRAKSPWHGSPVEIELAIESRMFHSLSKTTLRTVCYNSLIVEESSLSSDWQVVARNKDSEIMAMEMKSSRKPCWSLQFHPESFLSEDFSCIVRNWVSTF